MNKLLISVGTIRSKVRQRISLSNPIGKKIRLEYPTRLEAMALDSSRIALRKDAVYTAGQINFKIASFRVVEIEIISDSGAEVSLDSSVKRPALVRHSVALMRNALGFQHSIKVSCHSDTDLRHCGFGSSSNTIASTAFALNELFGNPLSKHTLVQYVTENHGEETDADDNSLVAVQCIGGSATAGVNTGAVWILAGRQDVILSAEIDDVYKVVVGIPTDFTYPDARYLMEEEVKALPKFIRTGKKFGKEIAYRLVHEAMPELSKGQLTALGTLIFDYRFNMGSIENCSFVFPRILEIADAIRQLKSEGTADILALSSVGPGFFAVTKEVERCREVFEKQSMKTYVFSLYNGAYKFEIK